MYLRKKLVPLTMASLFCLAGCESHSPVPPAAPVRVADDRWQESVSASADGNVVFKKSEMPEVQKEAMRTQLRQTDLLQIPSDPFHNATLFKIRNVPEYNYSVFIGPRIYAYDTGDGARMAPEFHSDGTVSLPFPIALISGTVRSIKAKDSKSLVQLPDSVLVKDMETLRSKLAGRFGIAEVANLPGCPKRITIVVNQTEFDATPKDLAGADYCTPDLPFIVTIRVPVARARYIMQEALYSHQVDVRAVYETRVPFSVAKLSLSFNKQKIFEELKIKASGKIYWLDADVNATITNIVREQAMRVQIQGDVSPQIATIVDQATKEFFTPFKPDPQSPAASSCQNVACFQLNYNYLKDKHTFEVEWQQSENALTGQSYVTWTGLHPLMDKTVRVGTADRSRPTLSNQGPSLETGLTVVPGDLLELKPSRLILENKQILNPQPRRISNPVCVSSYYAPNPRCFGSDVCADPGILLCSKTEDQWTEITDYGTGIKDLPATIQDQPSGTVPQLYEGLAAKFTWANSQTGQPEEMTCKLNVFNRYGDGSSLIVRLEDAPSCPLFAKAGKAVPMLSLVNQIKYEQKYLAGRYVKIYTGRVLETPVEKTFVPKVEFIGEVSIRGYEFGSGSQAGTIRRR